MYSELELEEISTELEDINRRLEKAVVEGGLIGKLIRQLDREITNIEERLGSGRE